MHFSDGCAPAPGAPDTLEGLCADLTTATNINRALSQIYLLLAQGRISQKQAVAFGYLSQLLLQTVPGIRAEHASAFGYPSWESRLKKSLEQTASEPTSPPTGNNSNPVILSEPAPGGERSARSAPELNEQPSNGVVGPEKRLAIKRLFRHDRPVDERVLHPDFGDLLRRGRALMDRKYDMTPEGRHEAKALALELELMNPAPAKPRRDRFGQVVDLVRRIRDHQHGKPGAAIDPQYLDAIRSAPHAPPWLKSAADPARAHAQPHSAGSNVAPPCPEPRRGFSPASSARPNADVLPSIQGPVRPAPQEPACRACPEPRREHRTVRPAPPAAPTGSAVRCAAPPSNQPPIDPAPPKPPAFASPQEPVRLAPKRVGHTVDWYAPASWSQLSPPALPALSLEGSKLERLALSKLERCGQHRGMSNSRARHLQHLHQSRSFWR